jgi:hypothetical protein
MTDLQDRLLAFHRKAMGGGRRLALIGPSLLELQELLLDAAVALDQAQALKAVAFGREAIEDMRSKWRENPAMPAYQRLTFDYICDLALAAIPSKQEDTPSDIRELAASARRYALGPWFVKLGFSETVQLAAEHAIRLDRAARDLAALDQGEPK